MQNELDCIKAEEQQLKDSELMHLLQELIPDTDREREEDLSDADSECQGLAEAIKAKLDKEHEDRQPDTTSAMNRTAQ